MQPSTAPMVAKTSPIDPRTRVRGSPRSATPYAATVATAAVNPITPEMVCNCNSWVDSGA